MLKTTEKLDKTSDRISQGRAQLAETEVRHPFYLLPAIICKHHWATSLHARLEWGQGTPQAVRISAFISLLFLLHVFACLRQQ